MLNPTRPTEGDADRATECYLWRNGPGALDVLPPEPCGGNCPSILVLEWHHTPEHWNLHARTYEHVAGIFGIRPATLALLVTRRLAVCEVGE
jgi:hypothetical protein